MKTRIASASKEVIIGDGQPTVLIGERINPTGRKKLSEVMRTGDLDMVRNEAVKQQAAGADVIDVNCGVPGVDEVDLLTRAVQAVAEAVDLPLSIDTPNHEALAAALKVYKGKALVNSVTGEEKSMANVLPLVKEHGAAVVALLQGDGGIPADVEGRMAVAETIVERAESLGIPREDLIMDCMAMTVGADSKAGAVTLETMHRLRDELGVNLVLGASNISFGLPEREHVNGAFVALAISAGATCLIVNTAKVRPAVLATDLLLGRDDFAGRYIAGYRERLKQQEGG